MRTSTMRIAAGLAAAALTVPLFAAPAAAEPATIPNPDTGLVFYSSNPLAVVARQAAPDDLCRPFPALFPRNARVNHREFDVFQRVEMSLQFADGGFAGRRCAGGGQQQGQAEEQSSSSVHRVTCQNGGRLT